MTAAERFLKYVSVNTPSDENVEDRTPSTDCQFDLAHVLEKELIDMGFRNVRVTKDCFVYAELPATSGREQDPVLGLIAHMDTAPSFNGNNVKPCLLPDYDGKDVLLAGSGDSLTVGLFPHLPSLKGQTLITTDGTTLLGGDDKAGIAEIITACEKLMASGREHGPVAVAFTPDEEIGLGVHSFDVPSFGANYAYTVDGGPLGEVSYENFNACEAVVEFHGLSVHPGSSKNKMINACLMAMEFNASLPQKDTPRDTEGYEGFFHLEMMKGDVSEAKLAYIVRDHSAARFEERKEQLRHIAKIMEEKWGKGSVNLSIREQYRNMREKIEPCFFLVKNAKAAWKSVGVEPFEEPVRGGTDGAQLCYMGLPCPNLGTGGYACHGPYEHITVESLEKVSDMLVALMCARIE